MATIRKRTWRNSAGEAQVAWQVSYIDQKGERRRRQFDKKKDADSWLVKARAEVATGIHTPDSQSITIAEAANIWLRACELGRDGRDPVEPHTLRQYQSHVDHHIKPLIGLDRLNRLTTPKVVDFRDQLLETRSRALSRKVLTSLKSIITESQTRGLVAQNAAKPVGISTAKRHKEPVRTPTKTEVKELLAALDIRAQNPTQQIARAWRRYRALLMTAVHTGMRASELRGLSKRHIDLAEKVIHVRQRADETGIIGSVKSSAGRRDIPIPKSLTQVLRLWLVECPPGDLAFPNWRGNVEAHSNIHSRCWLPINRLANLTTPDGKPRYRFHALRHFHASFLIASGATPKEVMSEMGHSSIQVTFDTYGHLFPEDDHHRLRRAEEMAAELSS